MSQHIYKTTVDGSKKVTITMGYDRPLDYLFCTVLDEDENVVYSNLDDDNAGIALQDVDYYHEVFERLRLVVPESMFHEVATDQKFSVGNRVVLHLANGQMREPYTE